MYVHCTKALGQQHPKRFLSIPMMWLLPQERERRSTGNHLKEKELCLLTETMHGEIFASHRPHLVRFATETDVLRIQPDAQSWHKGYILAETRQLKAATTGIDGEHVLVALCGRLSPFPTCTGAEGIVSNKIK